MRLALVIILVSIAKAYAAPQQLNNSATPPTPVATQEVKSEERPAEKPKAKKQAEPKPKAKPKAVVKPKRAEPKYQVTGNKQDWLRQAGIPESQWKYVDYIVSKESSWNPLAVNKSSGACSLAQALPCSKIPGDWRNPVNALKWQYGYVKDRYGGYAQAYAFWTANSWY